MLTQVNEHNIHRIVSIMMRIVTSVFINLVKFPKKMDGTGRPSPFKNSGV